MIDLQPLCKPNALFSSKLKFKRHERDALFPLYLQHSLYLVGVIRGLDPSPKKISEFLSRVPAWESVATCHEVALNSFFSIGLETHQNPLGKEYEYTNHPKARNVSRNKRVKLIWRIVHAILSTPSIYEKVAPLSPEEIGIVRCPFCKEEVWDGTCMQECEHLVLFPDAYGEEQWTEIYYYLRNLINDHWYIYSPSFDIYNFLDSRTSQDQTFWFLGEHRIKDLVQEIQKNIREFADEERMRQSFPFAWRDHEGWMELVEAYRRFRRFIKEEFPNVSPYH